MREHSFIVENEFHLSDDQQLFFDGEPVIMLPPTADMVDILLSIGIFPSKGQAKKNGWSGDKTSIPPGFSEHTLGKLRQKVWIFNPTAANIKDWNKDD